MAMKEKEQDKQRAEKKEQALIKARQEQEAAEDEARLARLEGPEEVKIKAEEPTVDVKPEPDRRVKMEEVDDDEDFGGQRAFDQTGWSDTESRRDDAEFLPTFQGFGKVAPDFNDEDNTEDLLDLDAAKPTVKRSESVGPSLGSMGPPASVVPLAEQKVKEEQEDDSPWSSVGQLVAFREMSTAIGDDYLKSQGVKLVKGRKRKGLEFKDSEARRIYKKGKKDAETIDVRQKRVKDVEMD
jgi:copper chaperone CopZ